MMASANNFCVFAITCLTAVSAFSISYDTPHGRGRKLFGGYRIVPKICQPSNPSSSRSNEPAICMFNHECTSRKGQVVGSCIDGFLYGACCQLPAKNSQAPNTSNNPNASPITENLLNLSGIDRSPIIPISSNSAITKISTTLSDNRPITKGTYTKITTFTADRSTPKPSDFHSQMADSVENAEKPQIPMDSDVNQLLQANIATLLGQQDELNDLRLPVIITNSNNDIRDNQETEEDPINPVTTLLTSDQILQIADPVDQLPALFSQGQGQNNHSGADTVLLNENGTYLNENNNPDEHFKPEFTNSNPQQESSTKTSSETDTPTVQQYANVHRITGSMSAVKPTSIPSSEVTQSRTPTKTTIFSQSISYDAQDSDAKTTMTKMTTPMSTTYDDDDDLVRVPTITYDAQSGNKKHDELDREEIAINHIISILNATTPTTHNKITQQTKPITSSINTWTNIQESLKPKTTTKRPSSKPSTTTEMFPYTFFKPGKPTNYYHYDPIPSTLIPAGSSTFSTSLLSSEDSSNDHATRKPAQGSYTANNYDYTTRPSSNPPAPTVIVLGPLGTEYTTLTTQKPSSRKPTVSAIVPSIVTKLPSVGTTITHNISTFISTNSAVTSNNHVVSTSYISVNLKDNTSPKPISTENLDDDKEPIKIVTKKPSAIWTTLSPWSDKPSFHLKPSNSDFTWPNDKPVQNIVFKQTTMINKPVTSSSMATTQAPKVTSLLTTVTDDETPPPDDLINFPPVRNPNLSQQEKPSNVVQQQTFNETDSTAVEFMNENEIPTPSFVEDAVLTNKVDVFVNKIVQSLQGNFQDLKDVVYSKRNVTAAPVVTGSVTKKPPTRKPTKPTSVKPLGVTTKRPPTKKPARPATIGQKPGGTVTTAGKPSKPTTLKPRPTSVVTSTTKRPQTVPSKRKPTRKPTTTTTTTTTTTEATLDASSAFLDEATDTSVEVEDSPQDYRTACGIRPLIKTGRIVGGKSATFGAFPWQVLIREQTWLGLFTKNKCGGVLISNRYVATAAHCQPGFLATLLAILGDFDLSGGLEAKPSVTRNVKRIIVNRNYDPATFENDLALLELESPVVFDAHIVPICMPEDDADFTGRMATVTGWGRVKYNGGTPSVLQEVQVPIMENAVCQEMFKTAGHSKLILDSFLCAGYASGQKDSCEGDSGGPLVIQEPNGRWVLVGTVSHGIKCAAPYLPGVYMRTTYFKPWLHGVTGV